MGIRPDALTGTITEDQFQRQVMELAHVTGWTVLHVRKALGKRDGRRAWQTTTNLRGWPDLLMWRPGRMIAAELKSETGRTTPEQRDVLASLEAAGVECHVWRPSLWPEIVRILQPVRVSP